MCRSKKPRYDAAEATSRPDTGHLGGRVASWQLAAQQSLSLAVPPNAYSHKPLISWAYPQASGQAGCKAVLRCLARKENTLRRGERKE